MRLVCVNGECMGSCIRPRSCIMYRSCVSPPFLFPSIPSPRPKKLPLEGGMKIARSEYNRLLEHGCDIQVPQKAAAEVPIEAAAEAVAPNSDSN